MALTAVRSIATVYSESVPFVTVTHVLSPSPDIARPLTVTAPFVKARSAGRVLKVGPVNEFVWVSSVKSTFA